VFFEATSDIRPSVVGISFDGLAVSGIVNGFLNLAAVLRGERFRAVLDLGFDITIGRTVELDCAYFPPWVEPVRCLGAQRPRGYTAEIVEEARRCVFGGTSIAGSGAYADLCRELAALLVATFSKQNLRFLVVENGTLPDNPLFTEAVYLAIAEYGAQRFLGKYVLWRDHDLMWSAEPHLYSAYPYPGVRKPEADEHVHYAVMNEWMRKRMQAWAPLATYHIIPNRYLYPPPEGRTPRSLRNAYSIPDDAYLIARCTRVVPQKTIERDLRLLDGLQRRLRAEGSERKVFLFVTGPTGEDTVEFNRLCEIERSLSIAGQVVWGNGLLPFNAPMLDPALETKQFSVRDLLEESDLSSFLTSYDYEGFGNPPGEAMAMSLPFISTTYELYHEVYGSKGAVAPLLPINRSSTADEPIPESFVAWTLRTLRDREYRAEIIKQNFSVCEQFFSQSALERQVKEIFPDAWS
jgi:glycosyltransferase involved in cell wall biosynthesis